MKTTLTIEQSAELIKRGVTLNENDSEVFDIGELLSLLPRELDTTYLLTIVGSSKYWYANYTWNENYDRDWRKEDELGLFTGERELIDSLYNLLLWAIDHNHVKLD